MFSDDRLDAHESRGVLARAAYWMVECACSCVMLAVLAAFLVAVFWHHMTPRDD